jgi:hypothetical protein
VSAAVADFNHDGITDLAVANTYSYTGQIGILLGNGDGSFQAVHSYASGGASAVAVGNFNGDGFPDLAVAAGRQGVTVLLNAADWGP